MAESMQGLHRSHRCTEVSNANIGEKVTVMGWDSISLITPIPKLDPAKRSSSGSNLFRK